MAAPKHGTQPIAITETPGRKAYCTCGWSEKLPYCDGAHNRMETGCKSAKVEISAAGTYAICQCHQSRTLPFCDGTHESLQS